MNRPTLPVWLLPCIALTALLSGYSIFLRHQVEAKNKAVTIAAEFETVEALAAGDGSAIDRALTNLKAQGVGAVVLSEETVSEILSEGYATISGNEITLRQSRVISSDKALESLANRVIRGLKNRFPGAKIVEGQESGQMAIRIDYASPSLIRQTAIGINPSVAQLVSQSGLNIICRMSNPSGVSNAYVAETIKWAKELGARVFLPQGDQVLGRRDAIPTLIESMRANGMLYATPEFTKIGGDANVVSGAPDLVIRLHSAQTAELDKLPLSEAIDRYAKAARERNMRVLLVRPISLASEEPLQSFADFVKKINGEIRKEGGDMGEARPFEDSNVPSILVLLIALSATPIAYFILRTMVAATTIQIAATILFGLLCVASISTSGRSFSALGIAIIYPIAAFLVLDARNGKNLLAEFLIVCGISLVGGLAVAGMLNGLPYFIKAQEFRGIKLAVFAPIVIGGWYFAARFVNLKEALRNPITWGAAFLTLLGLFALMFMNARTGNDSPASVSDLELKFRSVLDALLYVRPRTKSFLIGHPFLIVGIGLLLSHRNNSFPKLIPAMILCLTIGIVGQTDLVNTLCHLHTPVALSLLRNIVGLVPGCIIGMVIWFFVRRSLLKTEVEA